jgi:cytochrome c553
MSFLRIFGPAVLSLASFGAAAADPARGEELAWTYRCMTCHGETGHAVDARYPNLAGQKAGYIVDRLNYFHAETEPFNQMNGQARQLAPEDMEDLAAYYSQQR